ncbi:MAG: Isocitrate dehydrogenase [NADP] [Chlamydiia bacterium]|nr:Isocitrate dehydrogenase [NADP] [Chlamydiia bacterium]
MSKKKPTIALCSGDGIGPELMKGVKRILKAANVDAKFVEVDLGKSLMDKGLPVSFHFDSIEKIKKADALLKAPTSLVTLPGHISLELMLHTELEVFASICPCRSFAPVIPNTHHDMDLLLICESEDELRSIVEYRQSESSSESIQLMTSLSADKVCEFAFDFASRMGRHKIASLTMSPMRYADQFFQEAFIAHGENFAHLDQEHHLISEAAGMLSEHPEVYDTLVIPNAYSGILVDIASAGSHSHHLSAFGHIGKKGALFESPLLADQDDPPRMANPTSLIQAATLMLVYLGFCEEATSIQNALLRTLEEGYHTPDIYREATSKKELTCQEFVSCCIDRMGLAPTWFESVSYSKTFKPKKAKSKKKVPATKALVGVDVCIASSQSARQIRKKLSDLHFSHAQLASIANLSTKTDEQHILRFLANSDELFTQEDLIEIVSLLVKNDFDCVRTENLYEFDGKPGFTELDRTI